MNHNGTSGRGKGASGGGAPSTNKNKKKGAATPSLRDCTNCGAPEIPDGETHRMCSRCKMTFYCSAECQNVKLIRFYISPMLKAKSKKSTKVLARAICHVGLRTTRGTRGK